MIEHRGPLARSGFNWFLGDVYFCCASMEEFFDIPEEAEKIWFSVSKTRTPEAHKVKARFDFTDKESEWYFPRGLFVDGFKFPRYLAAEQFRFLFPGKCPEPHERFYIGLEYE